MVIMKKLLTDEWFFNHWRRKRDHKRSIICILFSLHNNFIVNRQGSLLKIEVDKSDALFFN